MPSLDAAGRAGAARLLRLAALVALALLLPAVAGCGDDGAAPAPDEAGTLPRETFVAVYVELRIAALRSPDEEIGPDERDRVLSRYGIGREELLEFVEVHGDRPEFMREVWAEVEARIDSIRNPDDTTSS